MMKSIITIIGSALVLAACGGGDKKAPETKAARTAAGPKIKGGDPERTSAVIDDARMAQRIRDRGRSVAGPQVDYSHLSDSPGEKARQRYLRRMQGQAPKPD